MRPSCATLLCALLALSLLSAGAHARWYQVEVVVFRHNTGLNSGGEAWPALSRLPDFSNSMTLVRDVPRTAGNTAASETTSPELRAFYPLPPSLRNLDGVLRRLRQSGSYEPILSAAWRQPSYGVNRAKRIYLSDVEPVASAATAPDVTPARSVEVARRTVEGIVSIKIAHLMHIEVDFLYYHDGTPVRLNETRKAKLREIHYFDHPLFGVIVQVSPYVLPSVPDTVVVAPDEPEDSDAALPATPAPAAAP